MTSRVLTFVLNLYISIMTNYRVPLSECMSYGNDFIILEKFSDNLSHKTFDGGGHVALVRHVVGIVDTCERHGIFQEYMSSALFVYTLQGHPMH